MLVLASAFTIGLLGALFILACLFMMMVILIQKPKGGGLSGAFGGGGGSAQSAFGSKTGDVLTWFTVALFTCFILLAMGLQWAIKADHQLDAEPTRTTPATQTMQTPLGTGDAADGNEGAAEIGDDAQMTNDE